LDFQVGPQDLNVKEFALAGAVAIGADCVEGLVATVRVQEFLDGHMHDERLSESSPPREIQQRP
jgi:hypothetical protein